jgi:hypothetical protein
MRIASALLLATMILVPTASMYPEPPQRDVPREMDEARNKLNSAMEDLQHAGAEWGGHRVKAMDHIQAAIRELNESERWAHEHHEMPR